MCLSRVPAISPTPACSLPAPIALLLSPIATFSATAGAFVLTAFAFVRTALAVVPFVLAEVPVRAVLVTTFAPRARIIRKHTQDEVCAIVHLSIHEPFSLVQLFLLEAQIWAIPRSRITCNIFKLLHCGRWSQEIQQSILEVLVCCRFIEFF